MARTQYGQKATKMQKKIRLKMRLQLQLQLQLQLPCFLSYLGIKMSLFDVDLSPQTFYMDLPIGELVVEMKTVCVLS